MQKITLLYSHINQSLNISHLYHKGSLLLFYLCFLVLKQLFLLQEHLNLKILLLKVLLFLLTLLSFQLHHHLLFLFPDLKFLYLKHQVQIQPQFLESYVVLDYLHLIQEMLLAQLQLFLYLGYVLLKLHQHLLEFHLFQHQL